MNEYLQIERGLLRLGEVTVAELADHSGVSPTTVRSYFAKRKSRGMVESCGVARHSGRGQPPLRWRLTKAGKASVGEELAKLRMDQPQPSESRERSMSAIHRSVTALSTEVERLEAEAADIGDADWLDRSVRLKRRAKATLAAASRLQETDLYGTVDKALETALGRLDHAFTMRLTPPPPEELPSELDRYMKTWLTGLCVDLKDLVPDVHCFPARETAAAPIILLDGVAGSDSDSVEQRALSLGQEMGSPVLHIPLDQVERRQRILDIVGRHLPSAAGCVAQLVLTMDSDHDQLAEPLAHSYALLVANRSNGKGAYSSTALARHEQKLRILTGSMMLEWGAAAAVAGALSAPIPSALLMIAGALISQDKSSKRPAQAGHTRELKSIQAVCLDLGANSALQDFFSGQHIHYHSERQNDADAAEVPRPQTLIVPAG